METVHRGGWGSHRLARLALGFLLAGLVAGAAAPAPRAGQTGTVTTDTATTSARVSLTVTVEGDGEVVSDPAGIACPGACSATFDAGTTVTLTANPGSGEFRGWDGACGGTDTQCGFQMEGDASVAAAFTSTQPPPPPPPPPPGPGPGPPPPPNIDVILEGLTFANVAFNAPTELHLGDTAVIELLVSGERPIRELKEEIRERGEREGGRIQVSDVVEARLTGLGFRIQAISDERQPVRRAGVTRWSWEIEPVETGALRLHLTISAIVDVAGSESTYTIETFRRELDVRVTWSERVSGFVGSNWQWLWTAILLPIGAWLLQRRRKAKAAA